MTNQIRPIHPGEILNEEYLKPLGMDAQSLAIAIKVPAIRINEILKEKRAITPEIAMRLASHFGGDPHSWLNLQSDYDSKIT